LRQHQIENDSVVRHLPDLEQRILAVLGQVDGKCLFLEGPSKRLREIPLIFGDEEPRAARA
jgi:hypothetical protein